MERTTSKQFAQFLNEKIGEPLQKLQDLVKKKAPSSQEWLATPEPVEPVSPLFTSFSPPEEPTAEVPEPLPPPTGPSPVRPRRPSSTRSWSERRPPLMGTQPGSAPAESAPVEPAPVLGGPKVPNNPLSAEPAPAEPVAPEPAPAIDENEEREKTMKTWRGRFWWTAGVAVGVATGVTVEFLGQGWWLNPTMKGVLSLGSMTLGLGIGGAELASNLAHNNEKIKNFEQKYGNAAHYMHRFLGGAALGVGSVSLMNLAGQALEHGVNAVVSHLPSNISPETFTKKLSELGNSALRRFQEFTGQVPIPPVEALPIEPTPEVPEKIATWVGNAPSGREVFDQTFNAKLEHLNIPKGSNVWREVHNYIADGFKGYDWQTPSGSHLSDKIAQFSIDFAQANGHQVSIVQPGEFDLLSCLDTDQAKFLRDLSQTKNDQEYLALLREYANKHPDIVKKIPAIAKALARGVR